MKNLVLDTCAILHIMRNSPQGKSILKTIEKTLNHRIIVSVVTKAELDSFVKQNSWRTKKTEMLNNFLQNFIFIDIHQSDTRLLSAYSQIDSYSKRKTKDKNGQLLPGSARKMGKNDLWIAATTMVIEGTLITTDNDFNHLNSNFIDVLNVQ